MYESAASGSALKTSNEEAGQKKLNNQSLLEGQETEIKEEKENLLEKCLTESDLNSPSGLVISGSNAGKFADLIEGINSFLSFEDEDGKPWKMECSYINHSYLFSKGWINYVTEKNLGAGDLVFFQRHRTDSSRLFIGCTRRENRLATLGQLDFVLPGETSSHTSFIHDDWVPVCNIPDQPLPGAGLALDDLSFYPEFSWRDSMLVAPVLYDYDFANEIWEYVLPDATSAVTSSETLKVEIPPRLTLHEQSVTGFDPISIISSGDNQDPEETYFISYIIDELCRRGFTPFRYDITRSTMVGNDEMLQKSRFGIMIVSKNYVISREGLDEFVAIRDHFKASNIITVFFKSSYFDEAFSRLGNSVQTSQIQKWRRAMKELSSINRYHYVKGDEVKLAKNIVKDVCSLVKSETNKNLKAMRLQLKSIMPLLNRSQSSAPQIVGLWGMAGIGKTTIAREIFRTQAERYDVCYFLPDFHIMCEARGLSHLRDEFLSKIFGEEKDFLDLCDTKLGFIRDSFLNKRVLIVLDGVRDARDVEVLVGGFGWFSGGHTIIVTSRNRQVLVQCNAKEFYEIRKLSERESFQLCSQYATGQIWKGKTSLISEIANYANGIPLALRVLGSSVQKLCISNEKEHMRRLRQQPPIEIYDAFKRSFHGLDDNEKNTFLDLSCFFKGENKDHVVNILDGCGFYSDLGICCLIDESLIRLVDSRIEMPNIFQDSGRFVVCQEHEEAGKRSRLWDSDDIVDVLKNETGTESIEGIFLDAAGLTFELSPAVFEGMHRLRLLKLCCPASENHCKICLPQGLYSLPDALRLLHWERYPLGSLPRKFNPKNLVELNMPYSNLTKLWKRTKNLEKLKRIILSHSRQLTEFPRLSKATNLEHIDLEGCTSLVKVNSSILYHHKLTCLSLKDCSHLQTMPTTVHLESLEVLNLSGCSELEDLQDCSPNLKELYLAGTAIREMPSSVGDLTRLITLDLENCKKLQYLPSGISSLKAMVTLKLSGCSNLKSHPTLDALLVTFDLESGNRLQHLPPKIRNQKAVVTLSAKRPASSMDLSRMEDMAPSYKRNRLKRVIESVILGLRKRKREKCLYTLKPF